MYSVTVKDHFMVAHSLPDPFFGPAQHMHGATLHVEATFLRETLTSKNVVIDIGEASEILKKTLEPLTYQNLDELDDFKGKLTTTEFLANYIHQEMRKKLSEDIKLKVVLHESAQASASYED